MIDVLQSGGLRFTIPLVILFVSIIALITTSIKDAPPRRVSLILHLGVFSAIWGLLGQSLGLVQALDAIEAVGGVSPAMLAGGLKVSFVTTVLGLINLTLAMAGWTILRYRAAA